jgi:GntR family transcriptional regulator
MDRGIDRTSPLPFYYQLKQILLTDLREQPLSPGDRLPGDHELCQTYGVSRTVVRQALAELETEGVIERRADLHPAGASPRRLGDRAGAAPFPGR